MKLLVIGSNGRVGSLIVKEALNANMDVTGLAKGENKSGVPLLSKRTHCL